MSESAKRTAKKQIEATEADLDDFVGKPHGEEQSIIDHLERPYGDEEIDYHDYEGNPAEYFDDGDY